MGGMFPAVALSVLVTIASSPVRANDHAPVSGEPASADSPSQVLAQWPRAHPGGANALHFRGKRTLLPDGRFRTGMDPGANWIIINGDSVQRFDLERLLELPVTEILQHPVWPPEGGRPPGPNFEHPVWPPLWFKGDLRIRLAAKAFRLSPPDRLAPRL